MKNSFLVREATELDAEAIYQVSEASFLGQERWSQNLFLQDLRCQNKHYFVAILNSDTNSNTNNDSNDKIIKNNIATSDNSILKTNNKNDIDTSDNSIFKTNNKNDIATSDNSILNTNNKNNIATSDNSILKTGNVIGFGGYAQILDEAHIMDVAVLPNWRGLGVASCLLKRLLQDAELRNITSATLEMRVSNQVASALYRRAGFASCGCRKGYYPDKEDAEIFWKEW